MEERPLDERPAARPSEPKVEAEIGNFQKGVNRVFEYDEKAGFSGCLFPILLIIGAFLLVSAIVVAVALNT